MRAREGGMLCGAMSLVGWSDASYSDQSTEGIRLLGYEIGSMSPTLNGPPYLTQWTSKSATKLANSSLNDAVYTVGEMVGSMSLLRKFYEPLADQSPGAIGFEAC